MEHSNNVIRPSFNKKQSYTVVSGDNAVRKAKPYLDRYQQEQLERQEERRRRWEKQIHKRAVQKELEERRARNSVFTLAEVSVIGVLIAVFLAACIFYLSQLARQNQVQKQLGALKSEYAALVEDNNARSSSIEGKIDHEWIYRYATDELGMMYPEKGQTVIYRKDAGSYVKQAEEIPEE